MKNKYLNPWHDPRDPPTEFNRGGYGPEFYENDAPVVCEYRGFKVYEIDVPRSAYYSDAGDTVKAYDYVYEGVCVTQRAGASKPKEVIDQIYVEDKYAAPVVREHLRKHGIWKEVAV
jgi:hypothetical protein